MSNLSFLNSDNFTALSFSEKDAFLNHVDRFIDMIDLNCLNEIIGSCNNTDIDKLFNIIIEESNEILNLKNYNKSLSSLNTLPSVKAGYEEYLRKQNLNYFVSSVLPSFEMNWHNIEWFSMVQLYRLLCIMAARDHSKSYSFSFAYILWRLYRYTRPTVLITPPDDIRYFKEGMLITNEFKLAKRLLKKVKEEIQINEFLKDVLMPDKNSGGWANESLSCKNGSELTLSSFRTSNRGPHPGWIVVDDFLDKSAIYSKEQREKFIDVFNSEIMNMILPQGQVITVGTPFHERDLYYVLKNSPIWRVFEYPGVFPNGSLLWENRYDFEALKNKRISLGSMIFSREILVRPISDTTSIFPYTILEKSFVGMRDFTLVKNIQSYKAKFKKIGTGVDLALSSSVGADYTVICTVGIDESDKIHLLNVVRLKGASYNEQISNLKKVNLDFDPSVILMETNGFQKIMADLSKEYGITNIAEWVTKGNNKKDLYEGLPSLAVFFERDEIKLPRGDEHSLEMTNLLCSELNSIAFDDTKGTLESVSEHDDFAMAFFLAIKSLKYVNNIFRINMIG